MTNQEAIETIKIAKAEVEWYYPMEYQEAFDMAISALEEQDRKSRELQKNKKRLPEGLTLVLQDINLCTCSNESWLTFQATGDIKALSQVYDDTHDSEGYTLPICYRT